MNDSIMSAIDDGTTNAQGQDMAQVEDMQEGKENEVLGGGSDEEIGQREEQEEKESVEFDPDSMEFESSDNFVFGGYDFTSFKDLVDFESDDTRAYLDAQVKELKAQGFTQAQVEYLLNKEIEYAKSNSEENVYDGAKVREELENTLTFQEKRDYRAVGGYLKDIMGEDESLKGLYREAMSNPIVYRLLHRAYVNSIGGRALGVGATKTARETRGSSMTFDGAVEKYTEFLQKNLGNGEDRTPIVNEIIKGLSEEDRKRFKEMFMLA